MNDKEPKAVEPAKDAPNEPVLTDQNLKFLRFIQSGLKVVEAYKAAGYTGESKDAAYVMYNKLKKKMQAIVESDSLDGVRLRVELAKILSLPTQDGPISIKDKLQAIKLTNEIVNGPKQQEQANITAFVVKIEKPDDAVIDVKEIKE